MNSQAREQRQDLLVQFSLGDLNYGDAQRPCTSRNDTYPHGQRGLYLASLEIAKTRAAQARAIFKGFDSEEELQGLSIKEAYARARGTLATKPGGRTGGRGLGRRPVSLRQGLNRLEKEAAHLLNLVDQAPTTKRQHLLATVTRARRRC